MPCNYLYQTLTAAVSLPSLTWRQDYVLATPELQSPKKGENICNSEYISTRGTGSGITLQWKAVPGATYYIIQLCNNSSFHGPTFKARKVATNSYELKSLSDIRGGETVYWRVMGYNGSGGMSAKSTTYDFKWECPNKGGKDNPNSNTGQSKSLCDLYNVKIAIGGPEHAMCCDTNTWHLKLSYDCKDENGNELLHLDGVVWSVSQPPGVPGNLILSQSNRMMRMNTACEVSQVVKIRAVATFTVVGTAVQFACVASHKVKVDCDTGLPEYKQWLQLYQYPFNGLITYNFYAFPSLVSGSYLDPAGTLGKPILGNVTSGQKVSAVAVGPVVQIAKSAVPTPSSPCNIARGQDSATVSEARVHVQVGCGLNVKDGALVAAPGSLSGDGLIPQGDECGIKVDLCNPCSGLTLTGGVAGDRCLELDTTITGFYRFFSLDPGSISLSLNYCTLTLQMSVSEMLAYHNCKGVVLNILENVAMSVGDTIDLGPCLYYCCG